MSDSYEEFSSSSEKEDQLRLKRRKILKALAGGVGTLAVYHSLPGRWTSPLIEQIVLPAHAATSGSSLSDPCTVTVISGTPATDTVVIQVDGFVVPATANLPTTILATPLGGGSPVTAKTTTGADGTFTAQLTITGGPGITRVDVTTTVAGADGSASCSANLSGAPGTTSGPAPEPDLYSISIDRITSSCQADGDLVITRIQGTVRSSDGSSMGNVEVGIGLSDGSEGNTTSENTTSSSAKWDFNATADPFVISNAEQPVTVTADIGDIRAGTYASDSETLAQCPLP